MNNSINAMEMLKKLKELLDVGAITQEEFDQKKAELMKQISFSQDNNSSQSQNLKAIEAGTNENPEVIDVEFEASPFCFKLCTHEPVEIQYEYHEYQPIIGRHQQERKDSPYLACHYPCAVEVYHIQQENIVVGVG